MRNVMIAAAGNGNTAFRKQLVENGADVNGQNAKGASAAYEAALNQRLPTLLYLTEQGADLHVVGGIHSSCLEAALSSMTTRDAPIISFLIESGANVNSTPGVEGGPLMAATSNQLAPLQSIRMLLEHGADVKGQSDAYGSCLEAAAAQQPVEMLT